MADPRVTQANIATTICVSGYTASVRPPVSYTDALKVQQMAAYGESGTTADYEEDHLIALEIGGDSLDPRNLWPELRAGSANAANKDTLENRLHAEVCAGTMTLAQAQQCIAVDWIACAASSVSRTNAPTSALTAAPATPAPTDTPTSAPATVSPPTAAPPPATLAITITASRYGFISATAGVVGASCTAKAKLPSGNFSTAQGLTPTKIGDANAAVSWTYTTVSSTKPGTGTHTVTCTWSGSTLSATASFTVP